MKQRKSKPTNNRYYNRIVDGGLNAAVQGYPVDRQATVLCNCVGYANGRFNEIINDPDIKFIAKPFKYQLVCNAENFIERAKQQGLSISKTPTLGGIMVWQKGNTLNDSDGAGHVAIVEEIIDSNTIITSESAYGGYAFKRFTRKNTNGRWDMGSAFIFRGCVVNPSVKEVPKPTNSANEEHIVPKKGEKWVITHKNGLNMYEKASKKSNIIMRLPKGTIFTVHDTVVRDTSCWTKVKKQNKYGWVLVYSKNGIYCEKKGEPTIQDKIAKACKEQTKWSYSSIYEWESRPTVEKSKKKSTCVTYVGCVLQRVGVLKPGEYIWHNGKGFGTGKVTGTITDRMKITYYNNKKSLADLKSVLKKGDIVMYDDSKTGVSGSGGHIEIYTGKDYTFFSGGTGSYHNTTNSHRENSARRVLCMVRIDG